MAGEETIAALLTIWDEGSAVAGWDELAPRLHELMERYRATDDEHAQTEIVLQIRDLLKARAPSLSISLLRTTKAMRHNEGDARMGTRGIPTRSQINERLDKLGQQESMVLGSTGGDQLLIRYTDISCPRRVWIEERLTITVALTIDHPAQSSAVETLTLNQEQPVKVRVTALRFNLLSLAEQEITLRPDADSPPVVFHLLPQELGRAEISLEFWQGGNQIAGVPLTVEVVATEPAFAAAPYAPASIDPGAASVAAPDLTLRIHYERGVRTLRYALWKGGVVIYETSGEVPFDAGPQAYIEQLYADLGLLRQGTDTVRVGTRGGRKLAVEDVERTLQRIGERLWDTLFPADLKLVYGRERAAWQGTERPWSMLVISDEPSIPWELVRPYSSDDWDDKAFWCETFHFARWLPRHPEFPDQFAPAARLPLAHIATLAPTAYGELAAIPRERQILADLVARHTYQDLSPQRATLSSVLDILEGGTYDWIHAVSHGDFVTQSATNGSILWLDDKVSLSSEAITGQKIRRHLKTQRPAFVFNACHLGREGSGLSGSNGWVHQLIGSGASLFLAPLWTVTDELGPLFTETFYRTLVDEKETAAAAVWAARQAVKQVGDPTWLAYSLYAHPNARVARPK